MTLPCNHFAQQRQQKRPTYHLNKTDKKEFLLRYFRFNH